MSAIDDEVRNVLAERAGAIGPLPDPLAGIEPKAHRMRRTRRGVAVAASAAAVSAVVVVVAAVQPAPGPRETPVASAPPSSPSSPSSAPTRASAYALDPADPWPYRGAAGLVTDEARADYVAEWARTHGVPADQVSWSPLFAQVYEPSGQVEVVYVVTDDSTGRSYYGLVTTTDAGATPVVDMPLAAGTTTLLFAVDGDEVPRLLVVTAPSVGQVEYAADGRTYRPIAISGEWPGVAATSLEGDTSADRVRVLDGNGDLDDPIFEGEAPG